MLARARYVPLEKIRSFALGGTAIRSREPSPASRTRAARGQGLSIWVGHVLAGRLGGLSYRVNVLLGDGECEEGQIWEAAMAAAHWKTDNLLAIVDHNKYQQTGPIAREMSLAPFAEKWQAFGWEVAECDGRIATSWTRCG